MDSTSLQNQSTFSYLKLFLALSRTTHALLDIATPCLAALVWLGAFPPLWIMVLGIGTALSGYLAVYALNDIVDFRLDRIKMQKAGSSSAGFDLDALYARHPMAQGLLSLGEGIMWAAAWGLVALTGAFLLNPACAVIFIVSIVLEIAYCLLLQVSHLRTLVSGMVKTMGALAAVFAVDPAPDSSLLLLLFLWLFFWEIGGQNIPNDLADLDEDLALKAKTIPARFGRHAAGMLIMAALIMSVAAGLLFFTFLPGDTRFILFIGALAAGLYLLILPAGKLLKDRGRAQAAVLFNRASYYPLAMLVMVAVHMLWF
jgi:4-hydroxybenzoate polyprenyltransferase